MNTPKLNKTFKFNTLVYIADVSNFCDLQILQGRVVGARLMETAYSRMVYTIQTSSGAREALPCNMFETLDELLEEIKNRVVL